MPIDKRILEEYIATANSGKYASFDEVNSKFPELKDYDPMVLQEYVATANSGKYSTLDDVNKKFPEFFDEVKKKEQAIPFDGQQFGGKSEEPLLPLTSSTFSPSASKQPKSTIPLESTGAKSKQAPFQNVDISKPELEVAEVKYDKVQERNRIQNYSQGLQKVQIDAAKKIKQRDDLFAGIEQMQVDLEASKSNPEQYNALIPQYNELVNSAKAITNDISADFNKIDIFEKGIGVTELKRQINEDTIGNRALEGVNSAKRILLEAFPATVQVASYLTQRSRGIDPATAEKVSIDIAENGFPNIKRWSRELAEENEDLRSVFDQTTAWDVLTEKDSSLLEKDWAKIGELSAKELVQTLPTTLAIMASYVNPIAGVTTTIMGTAGMELEELQGSDMTPDAKIANALTKGGLEYATEKVFGSIPMLKRAVGLKSKAGQEAYQNIVLETWNKFASKMGFAADVIEEVGSEMLNTIGGNYTDYLSGKTTEDDLYKGLGETFTTSLTMASTLSGAGRAAKYGNKKINELRSATKKLKEISESQETTPEVLQVIQDKVVENNEKIAEEAKKEKQAFDSMDDRTFGEATTLVQETQSLEQQLENNEVPEDVIPLVEEKIKKGYEQIDELTKQAKETNIEATGEVAQESGKTENEVKVEELRAQEQAEKDATDPNDQEKLDEIYDRYNELITPLLGAVKIEDAPALKDVEFGTAFDIQDATAENTVGKEKDLWGESQVWRERIENAGDILRELSSRGDKPDVRYLMEKVKKLRDWIAKNKNGYTPIDDSIKTTEDFEKSNLKWTDAVDSREYLEKFNSSVLDRVKREYEAIPTYTKEQRLALELVLDLINNNIKGLESKLSGIEEISNQIKTNGSLPIVKDIKLGKEQTLEAKGQTVDTEKTGENTYEYDPKNEVSSGDTGARTDNTGTEVGDIASVTDKGESGKEVVSEAEVDVAKALEKNFNPDFKNTIVDKLSKFDEQIANKKFPSALEVAEHVLPRSIFNKYKKLYELAARNNITVSNERLPSGMAAAWAYDNIQLNKDVAKYYLNDYNEFAETLNHEIIHGLISRGVRDNYALNKDLKEVMSQVLDRFDSASDEVKNIISYIQDVSKEFTERDFSSNEETGSLEELITYAFTNKEFADFLDSIPASKKINAKGKSIFQQLKNIIRDFISKKTKNATALDEINSVIDKYFDTSFNEKDIAERNEKYEWGKRFKANESVFDKYNNDPELISEAYYKGDNPKLNKAVDELLGIKKEVVKKEKKTLPQNVLDIAKETGLSPQEVENTYKKYDGTKSIEEITIEDYNSARAAGNEQKLENSKKAFEALLKSDSDSPTAKKKAAKIKEEVSKETLKEASDIMNNIDNIRQQLLDAGVIKSINCKWGK
jgi:hypothetical protein